MPNVADIAAMMTNALGTMSAGTMGQSVTSLAFSTDGRTLVTGGVESKANIDIAAMMSGAMSGQRPKKGSKAPDPADMMKDFKVEAVGQIRFWDVASGREIGAIRGHGRGVSKVAFSRDGKVLASAATDNSIKMWDAATRNELRTLTGHTSNIESMDFSPDGRLLASAGEDGSTFLWDTKTGEHLLTLISLDDGGEWMVVTPQGLFDGTPVSWNQILVRAWPRTCRRKIAASRW
jgi:WD40 repeat protein